MPTRRRGLLSIYAGVILLSRPLLRDRPASAYISHSLKGNFHIPNLVTNNDTGQTPNRGIQGHWQKHSMVLRTVSLATLKYQKAAGPPSQTPLADPYSAIQVDDI